MKTRTALFNTLILVMIVFCTSGNVADTVYDHFDDGVLDPTWNVTFDNSLGWSYTEAGTELTITDITIDQPYPSESHSYVYIKQPFLADGDFLLVGSIGWDSKGTDTAMQGVFVNLNNEAETIVRAGYYDPWIAHRGSKRAIIGETTYLSGENTLPFSGNTVIKVQREDEQISIFWDDVLILNAIDTNNFDEVAFEFRKYTYPTSTFGDLSTDYIIATPEPATVLLLGLGGVILRRRPRDNSQSR